MKKFTCTILALLLLVTLAACTGRNTSDGTSSANGSTASGTSAASESAAASSGGVEKISVFAWGGDGELAAHEARVALFNEAYAGKIEATLEVVPSQDYTTKLNAMFTAGNAHDVVMEAADYNGFYYRTRNFENLTPFVERDGLALDELLFQGIDNGNVHGDNYREALPFVGNTMVIAYNKDMFDTAGVPYPTDDWTWDEFIDVTLAMAFGVSVFLSVVLYLWGPYVYRIFTADAMVIEYGMIILRTLVPFFVIYIFIEVLSGAIRGTGDSLIPTIITSIGICGIRVVWIYAVVPQWNDIRMVSLSFPVAWVVTATAFIIYYLKGGWLRRSIARAGQENLSPAGEQALRQKRYPRSDI